MKTRALFSFNKINILTLPRFKFNYVTFLYRYYIGNTVMVIHLIFIVIQELEIFVLADISFKNNEYILQKTRCANFTFVIDMVVTCIGTGKVILVRRADVGLLKLCEVEVFGGKSKCNCIL